MSDQVGTPNPTDRIRDEWRWSTQDAECLHGLFGNFAVWEGQLYAIEQYGPIAFITGMPRDDDPPRGTLLFRLVLPSSSEPEGE